MTMTARLTRSSSYRTYEMMFCEPCTQSLSVSASGSVSRQLLSRTLMYEPASGRVSTGRSAARGSGSVPAVKPVAGGRGSAGGPKALAIRSLETRPHLSIDLLSIRSGTSRARDRYTEGVGGLGIDTTLGLFCN